jgi:hypothetical protein
LLATACASGGPSAAMRSAALLSDSPHPPGRDCRVLPPQREDARVDLVVDSAGLMRDLASLGARLPPDAYAIVSLQVDAHGWNARREIVEHRLTPAMVDTLQAMVFGRVRALEPGDPWGMRVRIDFGDPIRFRTGLQEFCAPRLLTAPEVVGRQAQFDVRSATAPITASPLNTVWLLVEVDTHGAVSGARVQRAPISIRNEAPLINFVHSLLFDPATLDGIPITSTTTVPVRFR